MQRATLDGLGDRHHQLRPARTGVALELRDAAHDAVAVDFEIDMAEPGRRMRERRHRFDRDAAAGVIGRGEQHRQIGRAQRDRVREFGVVGLASVNSTS